MDSHQSDDNSMLSVERESGNESRLKGLVRTTKETAGDTTNTLKARLGRSTDPLCSACRKIPFGACLPTASIDQELVNGTSKRSPLVFCKSLGQILDHRKWCKFCGLLLRSVCQEENDLLKPEHISKHIQDSVKLRKISSFAEWVNEFPKWRRIVGGEDIWPFGYTIDQQQAAKAAQAKAESLFSSAEDKDINKGVFDEMYETRNSYEDALEAANLGLGIASVAGLGNKQSQEVQKVLAGAQLVTSNLAILNGRKRRRLPCIFVIRAYRRDEAKAGVLSVRVYGHGRAPLAQLKEICHFSLRFEGSEKPRAVKEQIWYGKSLGTRVDVEFFEDCVKYCEKLHSNCRTFQWSPLPHAQEKYKSVPFRLIDVETKQVFETDFEAFIKPGSHYEYIALSYSWGTASSIRINSHPARLTLENVGFLQHAGVLEESVLDQVNMYLPKTISDAMDVVRRVGKRYLWVDSLCIIQHDGHLDNEANIARMGRIYGEALFTIVAADSHHADSGLKGVNTPRIAYNQILEDSIVAGAQLFLPASIEQSFTPWDSRAWCFQEKLLSRRLLVFTGGFAVWHCRGGVWREDVNALDGDGGSAQLPWPRLMSVPRTSNGIEAVGIQSQEEDDSVRLNRLPAMDQYIEAVEDFSRRDIGDSWRILDAFEGLQSVFACPELLDSPFRYGLPSHSMDVALLWQPKDIVRRRKPKVNKHGNIIVQSPPSWSWAGWEAAQEGSKGAAVNYEKPFDVQADDLGMVMRINRLGEERIRPRKGSLYGLSTDGGRIEDLGMFSLPNMAIRGFKDWESDQSRPAPRPRGLDLQQITNRHLVLRTEVATIQLGAKCIRIRTSIKLGSIEYCRQAFDAEIMEPSKPGTILSEEQWTQNSSGKRVGVVKMNAGNQGYIHVEAMVLSEAQYLGNEKRVDVLGYPVYNIMIIKYNHGQIAERIGMGKIYKHAWRKLDPRKKIVILE
jgi:hypothetical protein